RAGGEDVPPQIPGQTTFAINSTVIGVVGGDFHYGLFDNKVDVGARAWTVLMSSEYYDIIYTGGGVVEPSRFQFVLEPQVGARIGSLHAVLGFIWPLGGRLGSDQQVNGLRLTGAYAF